MVIKSPGGKRLAIDSWIRHILKFIIFTQHKNTIMTKQERVTFVINTLKELYPTIPIPLDHKDPYTLLIAVLLSAQCTDACK
jgi:hypothetical protein